MSKRAVLYSTEDSIISVDDSLSLLILEFLKCKERNFKDIVFLTKKAKSSINLKLTELEKRNLIQSRLDPEDHRKKFYFLTATQISSNKIANKELFEISLNEINKANNPHKFMTGLFKSFKYVFEDLGINIQPVLEILAQKVGNKMSEKIKSDKLKPVLKEIANIYKEFKLGKLEVISLKPCTVALSNSFECENMPCSGECLSFFDTKFIKAILEKKLNKEILIKNKNCKLKEKKCLFEIWLR